MTTACRRPVSLIRPRLLHDPVYCSGGVTRPVLKVIQVEGETSCANAVLLLSLVGVSVAGEVPKLQF